MTQRNDTGLMYHGLKSSQFPGTLKFLRRLIGDEGRVEQTLNPLPAFDKVIEWADRQGAQVAVHLNGKRTETLAIYFPDAAIHRKFWDTRFGLFDEVVTV